MTEEEKLVIEIVKKASPAVVNIIISQEDKKIFKKDKERVVGGGSGFIISNDGLILTNRHVVSDEKAKYTAETQAGKRYPITIIGRDQINDIAILKINSGNDLPFLELGNSENLHIGQTVITIGNALSQFHNSVSKGITSGLLRVVSTEGSDDEVAQNLRGLIQTDAAINPGNSGGPMLNTEGKVIGINAVVVHGAQNISFAIPISNAKKDIEDIKKFGKIIQPSLGVRYVVVNDEFQKKYNLPINYGAWIIKEHLPHDLAVTKGSTADKAGIKEDDIILEFNNTAIKDGVGLDQLVAKTNVGDIISIKILRDKKEKILKTKMLERK
ncbi:trypsin-like peptidase domain-containing protein [Candidatus Azambacteria bacterium]|nr:trypsin-like peptidase domain-containing protein [Candidatus Azambacteria bacterium]